MRIAFLVGGWAGFNDAACRELAALGHDVLVVREGEEADVAYADLGPGDYGRELVWSGTPDQAVLERVVAEHAPDAVVVVSWHFRPYRAVLRSLPAGTLRVLWMDNVWRNIAKQWVGRAVAPWWVRSLFDAVMVPSDRTEFFARRLGFGEGDVIRGSLSADTTLFGSGPRTGEELQQRATFLACMRLVHHKGADVLAEAYRSYRAASASPWGLRVAGLGPLAPSLEPIPGVELLGFRQPAEVADLMREASCLVVPSREEPYGVTLHEGALSGLPVVTTYFVGAAPFFVQDGQNGWTVPGGDADALAEAMLRVERLDAARLGAMSDVSRALGARTSSAGWARNLDEQLRRRVSALRSR